jgi:hypothetical protein
MAERLQSFMCKYMQQETQPLEGCLLAAYRSIEGYLCLLTESLGTPVFSEDLRLCELLTNAGLFRDEIKITRDGRNRYRLFYLTDEGRRIAEQISQEGYDGEIPQSIEIA